MPVTIRPFDPRSDAEGLADLFTRQHYGTAGRAGQGVDADALMASFAQNGVYQTFVAVSEGAIIGTTSFCQIYRGRCAPPGELFAGYFLIASSERVSAVGGELFNAGFAWLAKQDLRVLRLFVEPTNESAIACYVRAGFRSVGPLRADSDDVIQLVNYLPGILPLSDAAFRNGLKLADVPKGLRAVARDDQPSSFGRFMYRMHGRDIHSGVSADAEGRQRIRYEFLDSQMNMRADIDATTGTLLAFSANDQDLLRPALDYLGTTTPAHATRLATHRDGPAQTSELLRRDVKEFTVTCDTSGTVLITHPRHVGPLMVDPMPEANGLGVAIRQPRLRQVTAQDAGDHWLLVAQDDGVRVERQIEFRADGFLVRASATGALQDPPAGMILWPYPAMRLADWTLEAPNKTPASGPVVKGIRPALLLGFDAAADRTLAINAQGVRSRHEDSGLGLSVAVEWRNDGLLRPDGSCLARTPAMAYRVEFAHATGGTLLAPPAFPPLARWERTSKAGVAAWTASDDPVSSTDSSPESMSTLTVTQNGLTAWRSHGTRILSGPSHPSRSFGYAAHIPAALWPDHSTSRADIDRGVEWCDGGARFDFVPTVDELNDIATWTVVPNDDFSALDVYVVGDPHWDGEIAVGLCPGSSCTRVTVETASGQPVAFERAAVDYQVWTRHVVLHFADGVMLDVVPAEGDGPEIQVRSTGSGFLVTMFSQAGPGARARWHLDAIGIASGPTPLSLSRKLPDHD